MRTNVVEEFAQEQADEINRLLKANTDLLADSKRHEALAADRLRMLENKYPDSERLLVTEITRLRNLVADKDAQLRLAKKLIRLLKSNLLSKGLGKLGLHMNNQKSIQAYKILIDKLDMKGWLYPPQSGNYSQRLIKQKHQNDFEEYVKANWRDYYTKRIDQYSRTTMRWHK
jgi:hypothetical protein